MVDDILDPKTVNSVNDRPQTSLLTKERILKDNSDVFEGLGCMDGLYHMDVDENKKPVFHPPRKVPVALRDRLKEELDNLVKEKIIRPVTEPTSLMFSLVLVNSHADKLRICINPQNLNKALLRAHYPVPAIEEMATRLSKAKMFSVLDA